MPTGLTGGSGDTYILHAVTRARELGMRAVVANGRGTAQSPVTTPQYYSASYTGDIRCAAAHAALPMIKTWALCSTALQALLETTRHEYNYASLNYLFGSFDLATPKSCKVLR